MAAIYSVRFFSTSGTGKLLQYTVPIGKRAVVRAVASYTNAPGTDNWFLSAAGIYVYGHIFPAAERAFSVDLRITAYGGEQLGLLTQGEAIQVHVSGFLFDDQVAAVDRRGRSQEWPLEDPEPVPYRATT